uniref:Apolipophorin-III n=1 Tax=Photinus pyralis TaxID=7054 RepID=A0A1Y1N302_PHOPY
MAKFVILLVATVVLQVALAKPKPASQDIHFDQFVGNMNTMGKDFAETFKNAMPAKNDVNNALVSASKTFSETVEQGSKSLSEHIETNKPLVEKLVKETAGKISEKVAYAKGVVESARSKGQLVKEVIDSNIKSLLAEGRKIEAELQPHIAHAKEHLAKLAGSFFNVLKTAGERFRADIAKALE